MILRSNDCLDSCLLMPELAGFKARIDFVAIDS